MIALSSYLSVAVVKCKMILKYQSGEKHELTNDMMKRAKGEVNCEIQQPKTDDVLYEHIDGRS